MKKLVFLAMVSLLPFQAFCNPFSANPEGVGIAAFNIRIFGRSKMKKPEVVRHLVRITKRYDIVLIQEILDKSGTAIRKLLGEVNRSDSYRMVLGERIGRSSMKEQYAFPYRPSKLEVLGHYQYPDEGRPDDSFHREPLAVRFRVLKTGFDFLLIAIHTDPDEAVGEIDRLAAVYDASAVKLGDGGALILGDFNADCSYVKRRDWAGIRLRKDRRFTWLIGDSADTTVSKNTDCAYDRFVAVGGVSSRVRGAKVFRFGIRIDERTGFECQRSLSSRAGSRVAPVNTQPCITAAGNCLDRRSKKLYP
ncbi:MAG: deoxyribonuclease I [Proteobacteria bacterium]|nr:deoxyribonuclease I [Pseudomonadota bacterium]